MTDYFNNSSNDYINPSLPVCPGVGDYTGSFEFIPKRELGVISGSEIMASLDFTNFTQPVTAWTQERKTLNSGEVFFVQGLTKGLSYETWVFPIPSTIDISSNDAGYYTHVDMSVGYYSSFAWDVADISVNGDYVLGIDIANAIDIEFGVQGINIDVTSSMLIGDVSNYFRFVADTAGYDFTIPNFTFTLDGSTHTLINDPNQYVTSAKYPNTAMLGYVIKVIFPDDADVEADHWIYSKHIPTSLTYYEASTGLTDSYVQYTKQVDAGNNVSTDEIMSSGDYLNWIDTNGYWDKIGQLKVWLSTEDPAVNSEITNLLSGFYLYNPHTFPVIVEYMTIV